MVAHLFNSNKASMQAHGLAGDTIGDVQTAALPLVVPLGRPGPAASAGAGDASLEAR